MHIECIIRMRGCRSDCEDYLVLGTKATTAREINILIGNYRNWLLVITLEVGFVNTSHFLKSSKPIFIFQKIKKAIFSTLSE